MATRIMLLGGGRAGKGVFCKTASQFFGLSSISSSKMACDLFLYEKLKQTLNYNTLDQCYADRSNHRSVWYEEIKAFNTPDKSRLGSHIFSKFEIYDGCRDLEELNSIKKDGYYDISIWIDGGDRVPPESIDSMNITSAEADVIIRNEKSELEFIEKVKNLLSAIYK